VNIRISRSAGKALKRSNKRKLLTQKILEMAKNPDALAANVIRLQGRSDFRLRVQDWRIVFRIEDGILHIDEIEPRGSIYEDKS
jgi:mRNA interferase RelE/StbE